MVFAAPSTKKAGYTIPFDVVLDEETKRVGEEAQLVGKILCDVAQGWKETSQKATVPADEAAEYFFKKIFRGARKVFRQVGKAGLEIGKRFLGQKAGEMIRQKIRERTGRYALGDDESYGGLVLALSEDIDQLGKDLVAKGVQLNGGIVVQEMKWDPDTKKFLKDCVAIF
uniref:Putative secreted protein n=1 Tax=Ixodes ricinus TaxID=34613 RepID=A0A131Y8U3_IXORI